jgi:hypothetical protein
MNKFKYFDYGDTWLNHWRCLSCDSADTGVEYTEDDTVIFCYECNERQKLSEMEFPTNI